MDLTNEDVADILALLDSLPYDELDLETSRFRLTLRRTPDGWTQASQVAVRPGRCSGGRHGVAGWAPEAPTSRSGSRRDGPAAGDAGARADGPPAGLRRSGGATGAELGRTTGPGEDEAADRGDASGDGGGQRC